MGRVDDGPEGLRLSENVQAGWQGLSNGDGLAKLAQNVLRAS